MGINTQAIQSQHLGATADVAIHGSISSLETALFASLADLVPGSKEWILRGSTIGSVNPMFNAIGAFFIFNAINSVYKAVAAHNTNRDRVGDALLSVVSSAFIAFVVFGADLNPAIGAQAPYVFAGVILFNAMVAAVRAANSLFKASELRKQLIDDLVTSGELTEEEKSNDTGLEARLISLSPTYKKYKMEAKNYAWQAARGVITAAAILTILVFGVSTGPLAGAIMGAVTAVFIGSFISSIVQRKKPAVVELLPADRGTVLNNDSEKSWDDYNNARYSVVSFEQKVDYTRYLKQNPGNAKQNMRNILAAKKDEYRVKAAAEQPKLFLFRNDALARKVDMIEALEGLLNKDDAAINPQTLNEIYRAHQGSLLSRGALSSFWKRFGGMQSVLEAVELLVVSIHENNKVNDAESSKVSLKYSDC